MVDRRSDDDKRRLIEANLSLASEIATDLADPTWPPLDAVQEANLVLMQVADDPSVSDPSTVLRQRIRDHFDRLRSDS